MGWGGGGKGKGKGRELIYLLDCSKTVVGD